MPKEEKKSKLPLVFPEKTNGIWGFLLKSS
jgi:hypothetical protein